MLTRKEEEKGRRNAEEEEKEKKKNASVWSFANKYFYEIRLKNSLKIWNIMSFLFKSVQLNK